MFQGATSLVYLGCRNGGSFLLPQEVAEWRENRWFDVLGLFFSGSESFHIIFILRLLCLMFTISHLLEPEKIFTGNLEGLQ